MKNKHSPLCVGKYRDTAKGREDSRNVVVVWHRESGAMQRGTPGFVETSGKGAEAPKKVKAEAADLLKRTSRPEPLKCRDSAV